MVRMLLALAFAIGGIFAQSNTVILVRHAERASSQMAGQDLGLSAAGKKRAEELARTLNDAHIDAIYTSDALRTIQTAEPLAHRLNLTPRKITEVDALVKEVKAHPNRTILIVHHSNTLPLILKSLGIAAPQSIGDTQYDYMFVVTIDMHDDASLLTLHYGD
jgi:broad specificity phosphatase PhoE